MALKSRLVRLWGENLGSRMARSSLALPSGGVCDRCEECARRDGEVGQVGAMLAFAVSVVVLD